MKKINTLLLVLFGLLLGALLFLVAVFFHTSIQRISSRNIKSEIQMLKTEENEFLKVRKAYREWQQAGLSYSRFKKDFLFQFAEFTEFRSTFESLLGRHGLRVEGLSYNIENLPDGVVKLLIGFQADGSYINIKRFIFNLEQLSGIAFFREIEMNRGKSGVQAKFSLEAYFVR